MLYKNKYRVEPARRPNWNYATAGFYFVTICTRDHFPYFGEAVMADAGESESTTHICLSPLGEVAQRLWFEIPHKFAFADLDEFVIMPNHVHGIIQIAGSENPAGIAVGGGTTGRNNPMVNQHSISSVIRWYKGRVSFEVRTAQTEIPFAWQARFHDRVIRDETELNRIRQYIRDNPSNWANDDLNTP